MSPEGTGFINVNKTSSLTSENGKTPGSRNHGLCKDYEQMNKKDHAIYWD